MLGGGWVQTEMGNRGAVYFGVEKAVDESANGMVKLVRGIITRRSDGEQSNTRE
jgi:hypothetical protein